MITINEQGSRERQPLSVVRPDFWVSTSNKQLNFLQHVNTTLKEDGRAAVVVPDNVLFEGGPGETIRRRLLFEYDVHTLLRLPPGIFYAQGIKTNVIFFERRRPSGKPATKKLWVYDLRTNMHFTLRTKRLEMSDLTEFVECYSADDRSKRSATWSDKKPIGRWRAYSYEELSSRDKSSLDLFWLDDENQDNLDSADNPNEIAAEIMEDLQAAILQLSEITVDLGDVK